MFQKAPQALTGKLRRNVQMVDIESWLAKAEESETNAEEKDRKKSITAGVTRGHQAHPSHS